MYLRAIVWIVVAIGVFTYGMIRGQHLVLHDTSIPWWAIVLGIGLIFLGWDVVAKRRKGGDKPP
jgi:hypothetical protein